MSEVGLQAPFGGEQAGRTPVRSHAKCLFEFLGAKLLCPGFFCGGREAPASGIRNL